MRRQVVLKFLQQPALAQPRIGHQRQATRLARGSHGFQRVVQHGQFCSAADQRGFQPFDAARLQHKGARLGALHQPAGDGRVMAFDGDGRLRFGIKEAPHLGPGVLADAQAPGGRCLFHARGDVDGQAAQAVVVIDAATAQHRPGVDADAGVEAVAAVLLQHGFAAHCGLLQQCQAAAHRALGVVFAGAVGAESRQQVVAGVLQHLATMVQDDGGERGQRAIDHDLDVFRVEVLAELGRTDDVQEHHADLAQPPLCSRCRCRRCCSVQLSQLLTQGAKCRVHHRVAEHGALGVQHRNGFGDGVARGWNVAHGGIVAGLAPGTPGPLCTGLRHAPQTCASGMRVRHARRTPGV